MSEAGRSETLRGWRLLGLVATALIVAAIPLYALREAAEPALSPPDPLGAGEATFVGREQCRRCHEAAFEAWLGSDHDRAMDVADATTVLGDFDDATFEQDGLTSRFFTRDGEYLVETEGPDGALGEFAIAYTFGYDPLQQYLVPFPGGRLQALTIAWDTVRNEWFSLYPDRDIPPDDWMHWTRSAMNWNGMCAECHSTNLLKRYDPATQSYATTWSEIDVSCEACHGPGSRHVAWAEMPPMARPEAADYELAQPTGGLSAREEVELCAPCHARRSELTDYDHTGIRPLDIYLPTLLDEGLYWPDGQILDEVYVYGSFLQSKMYENDVRCSDCHDVHSTARVREGNDLCLQCHEADAYDVFEHHFHAEWPTGRPNAGTQCVRCHMPEQPYMVVDWRADHSLRVPRPDLSVRIGTPNACNQAGCHDTKPAEWAAAAFTRWYGQQRRAHYGTTLAAGRERAPGAEANLVRLAGDALYPAIVRATALSLLGAYPGTTTASAFERALQDDDPLIRHTAVGGLPTADPDRLRELLAPLLADSARAVRQEAAVRLAEVPREALEDYQRGAFDAALAEYRESMTHSLDFAASASNLANLSVALGDAEEAERYYQLAIDIDDLFYPAKSNLALLYNAQGRNEEAARLLREVVEAYPEQYEAAYSLGLLLGEMGQYEDAAEALAAAAEGLPERPRIAYNLGQILAYLGRPEEAIAAYDRVLAASPGDLDALVALAELHFRLGDMAAVIGIAERVQEAHPASPIGPQLRAAAEEAIRRAGPR